MSIRFGHTYKNQKKIIIILQRLLKLKFIVLQKYIIRIVHTSLLNYSNDYAKLA